MLALGETPTLHITLGETPTLPIGVWSVGLWPNEAGVWGVLGLSALGETPTLRIGIWSIGLRPNVAGELDAGGLSSRHLHSIGESHRAAAFRDFSQCRSGSMRGASRSG